MEIPRKYLHHRVDRGLARLLAMSRDVAALPEVNGKTLSFAEAAPPLQHHYGRYLDEMLPVAKRAQLWWKSVVDNTVKIHGSHKEGMKVALETRLAGMAANEEFVSCIRKHWLAVSRINESLSLEQRAAPEDVLLLWPYAEELEDIFQVLIAMPYWPLGLDADGKWC